MREKLKKITIFDVKNKFNVLLRVQVCERYETLVLLLLLSAVNLSLFPADDQSAQVVSCVC